MGIIKRVWLGAVHGVKNLWQSLAASPISAVPETVEAEPSEFGAVMGDQTMDDVSVSVTRAMSRPSEGSKGSGVRRQQRKRGKGGSPGRKVRRKADGPAGRKKMPVKPAASVVVVVSKKRAAVKKGAAEKKVGARRSKKPSASKAPVVKVTVAKTPVSARTSAKKRAPATRPAKKPVKKAAKRPAKKGVSTGKKKRAAPLAKTPSRFEKHESNPLLVPDHDRYWESKAVFNPAAAKIGGKVHVLYRAIGEDDVSVLGYASSEDGMTIDERSETPVYMCGFAPVERHGTAMPVIYGSGGGWNGGCEDPRLTFIAGRGYLFFTAFDGWGSVRIGMSSISEKDFLAKRWNWSPRALISPQGEIHKNWVLFPEKIKGKFAVLHSISPRVRVAYVDDLDAFAKEEKTIKSTYEKSSRRRAWDSWVRGAGPPPIRTDKGWLLLYHAMDDRDPGRYKLGAMLLDRKDPEKVIARSKEPILEPDEWYENQGFKAGVVYCCGAVVNAGRLIVYYGGADTVVCAAEMSLKKLLNALVAERPSKLRRPRIASKRKKNATR